MQASAAGTIERAFAVAGAIAVLGVAPTVPAATSASPTEVLARVTGSDAAVLSYATPVHMDVRVRKILTFRMGFDGTEYFKRPDKVALDAPRVPAPGRKLFADLGTPLTWPRQYDLRVVSANGDHGPFHIEGIPKHPSGVAKMDVDVEDDPAAPLHVQWVCHDGSTVDMHITEQAFGAYELPKHAEADINTSGYKIHASIDYGPYNVNEAVADSIFSGNAR